MGLEPVAEEEEEVIQSQSHLSHNLLKRSKGTSPAVVSSLLLDPQAYYSQRTAPTAYRLTFEASPFEASVPVGAYIKSLNMTPTIASIYRSTAYITFDLICSLYYVTVCCYSLLL